MRAVVLTSALATIASMAGGAACAASPWYVSADLGAQFREDAELIHEPIQRLLVPVPRQTANSPTPVVVYVPELVMTKSGGERAFDPGLGGDLAVGYRLGARVRLEAEIGSVAYPIKRESLSLGGANGQTAFSRLSGAQVSGASIGLNAYYDFRGLTQRFTPYVGLGGGVSSDRTGSGILADARGRRLQVAGGAATDGFALAEIGLNMPLSPHWSIAPAYRYVRGLGSGDRAGALHVAKIGARFTF
ncbi:outer membrane protein [Phenylobacterium montanum]|uniref:Outer membrane beta-barrel protein n=1 Tax=Phenylobacterium montanum TaxID=2823693 RepID=A0A975FVU4_9CAUL|nr:outer membrane beta-barrel protein [Caulobacter sp. S6]QUD86076.1 outer membrane beta-barrel protein [Caulobacter sp. S6]